MEQHIQILKDKMLEDYKKSVWECLYYINISFLKEKEIKIIVNEYKINFVDDYSEFLKQFNDFKFDDLKNILNILNIEAESEWTNANRCEATALILWEYLKKLNLQ